MNSNAIFKDINVTKIEEKINLKIFNSRLLKIFQFNYKLFMILVFSQMTIIKNKFPAVKFTYKLYQINDEKFNKKWMH